jgi:hypothetical protein
MRLLQLSPFEVKQPGKTLPLMFNSFALEVRQGLAYSQPSFQLVLLRLALKD